MRTRLVIGVITAAVTAGVLLADPDAFPFFLILGFVGCAVAGYWLRAPAFLLVPLVAMGVEIAIGIPATLLHPVRQTPIRVVLEAPFWAGMPSLIDALICGAARGCSTNSANSPALMRSILRITLVR